MRLRISSYRVNYLALGNKLAAANYSAIRGLFLNQLVLLLIGKLLIPVRASSLSVEILFFLKCVSEALYKLNNVFAYRGSAGKPGALDSGNVYKALLRAIDYEIPR